MLQQMKCAVLSAMLTAGLFIPAAQAQQGTAGGSARFSASPQCSELINRTGYTVFGTVETDRVRQADGTIIHYKSNLRLDKDGRTKICASGPFFDGGTVELTLKTLLPVFSCRTKLGKPIDIHAARKKEGRGYDWSATCQK